MQRAGLPYRLIISRILIAFLHYTIARFIFMWMNPDVAMSAGLKVYTAGLRYDGVAIAWIFLPVLILHLYPTRFFYTTFYQTIIRIFFLIGNALSLLLNLTDSAWFAFQHKRSTADFLSVVTTGNDLSNNIGAYLSDYWYLVLAWFVLLVFADFLFQLSTGSLLKYPFVLPSVVRRLIAAAVIILLTITGFRGGWQLKPLTGQAAAEIAGPAAVPLVLNTPFTIIKSLRDDPLPVTMYMSADEANKLFSPQQYISSDTVPYMNVVVIILESFSLEYTGIGKSKESYSPFLDSLSKHSLTCTHAYANGKRSIEGIPAVIAGIPALMDEPFITSGYNTSRIHSLPALLKKSGYSSAFFHGGNNGTMGFDHFSKMASFDHYYGRNEYDGDKKDYDGHWGIFDHAFYNFMIRKINAMHKPFTTALFTLSSHHPYTIPAQFTDRYHSGPLPIHKSVQYADDALRMFFAEAQKQSWYRNTLFVITADHTGPAGSEYANSRSGSYEIPLLFYYDGINPKEITTTAQQSDILPTALHLIGYNGLVSAFGTDLLKQNNNAWAVNYSNGIWQLISGNHALLFNGTDASGLYDIVKDPLMTDDLRDENKELTMQYTTLTKAIVQQYRQSLLHNTIVKR